MKIKILGVLVVFSFILAKSASAQNKYYLSHVANGRFDGGSFRTTFILFNNTDSNASAILELTDDSGSPLSVPIGGLGTNNRFAIILSPGTTRILQTDGSGDLVTGAATVTATTTIGVSAIFTIYDPNGNYVTESGVGSSDPLSEFVLPVDTTGLFNTGLALFNAGSGNASITLILIGTNGQETSRTTTTLNRAAHIARFVAGAGQLFPAVSNFRGTLVVQSSVPIAALVLRQNEKPLSYTSLPVLARSSTKLGLNLGQVANGSFGSGSFKTSFLIFNIASSTANVSLVLTQDDGSPFRVTIPGSGTNSTFNFSLAAGASVFLQTDGAGAQVAGAATITSNVPIGASAIFSVFDSQGGFQTEAGVGDSPVLTSLTLPVDITGSFDTGVAFFNPGSSSVTLTLRLLDGSGNVVGSDATIPLAGKNHKARFVSEIFPGTSNFQGSLAISASAAVAALTLRQNSAPLSYTTLPVASGTATGKVQVTPLLSKARAGVTATSNVTVNETLPPGLKLSGRISGPGQPLTIVARAGDSVFSGAIDTQTGRYLIVLSAGTYNLKVCFQPSGIASGASVTITYDDPAPVQVSTDATRDITLPSVALASVSGAISGLSNLASATRPVVVFVSDNNSSQGEFDIGGNGSYQGVLPSGSYKASVTATLQLSLTPPESLALFNLGSLNVGSSPVTGNFTIPATAKISGSIRGINTLLASIGSQITASDTSSPQITQIACCYSPDSSSMSADLTGQYQLILARNRSYNLDLSLPLIRGTAVLGLLSFPVNANVINLNSDMSYDFNLPGLPGQFTISGKVTDSIGRGVSNVSVEAFTQSVTNAPNLSFTMGATTDAGGNYSFAVLSGTNYQIVFYPPAPKP